MTTISRRTFQSSLIGVLPLGILLNSSCSGLSTFVKYLDLGVAALDSALPIILGTSASPIINWSNLIAQAFNAATGILQNASLSAATKATQIANTFDNIVLPNISSLSASVQQEITKVVTGVENFLSSLGLSQPTGNALASSGPKAHTVAKVVPLDLTDVDRKVLAQDQTKLVAIMQAAK